VINHVENLKDFSSAEVYITELSGKLGWDETAQTTRLFNKLIKQKFGVQ